MNKNSQTALQQVCIVLNKHHVDYLVIGGIAVAFHGYSRVSHGYIPGSDDLEHDIDLWYKPATENYFKIIKVLDEFGFDTIELKERVYDPKKSFMRIPFGRYKVEFLPQMIGIDSFAECRKRAFITSIDETEIYVISRQDLLLNKAAVGRDIDKRDIKELNKENLPENDSE